jgi:hypothetical protein
MICSSFAICSFRQGGYCTSQTQGGTLPVEGGSPMTPKQDRDQWRLRMQAAGAEVHCSDPDYDPDEGTTVEFRLTWEGRLLASGGDNPRAKHKHEMRKAFHLQLKCLWEINPYLKHGNPVTFDWEQKASPKGGTTYGTTLIPWLADQYQRCGYRFVPLVREKLSLLCAIHILMLRPGEPGKALQSGDIDARLKTIFDALTMPGHADQLGGYKSPSEDEDPFFCLLEDDQLVSHVAVETDVLLQPVRDEAGHAGRLIEKNDARLIISVKIRPYNINPSNQYFG